jgi:hypothetical protein
MSYPGLDEKLAAAAEKTAGEPVQFRDRFPMVETFRGETVWEGIVTEYDTRNKQHVYAWIVMIDDGPQFVTVLRKPPVKNALDAVRVWLVSQARK